MLRVPAHAASLLLMGVALTERFVEGSIALILLLLLIASGLALIGGLLIRGSVAAMLQRLLL